MKKIQAFFYLISLLLFTSCIEIIDDLTINDDGSGTFKYNINLSSSKVKINSILALDSLDGRRVPSIEEIKTTLARVISIFEVQPGISAVTIEENYTDFIFKLSCDFESLNSLQNAIKEVVKTEVKDLDVSELNASWVEFNGTTMSRSVPQITLKKTSELTQSDAELLKNGSYTSITRFQREIEKFDNVNGTLSKNQRAIMLRCDPYALTQNYHLLDNRIYLLKIED